MSSKFYALEPTQDRVAIDFAAEIAAGAVCVATAPLLTTNKVYGAPVEAITEGNGGSHSPIVIERAGNWRVSALLASDPVDARGYNILHRIAVADRVLSAIPESVMMNLGLHMRYSKFPQKHLPVHLAACSDRLGLFKPLLERRTGPMRFADSQGQTALHIAALKGTLQHLPPRCFRRRNLIQLNLHGHTPLHLAIRAGNWDQVPQDVRENPAILAIYDAEGQTVAEALAEKAKWETITEAETISTVA